MSIYQSEIKADGKIDDSERFTRFIIEEVELKKRQRIEIPDIMVQDQTYTDYCKMDWQ